ncbi:FIG002776: hypothetical protein [hydrothermal vent metagenome]|uniref:JmjC domain-containing protein n=1 Tax=hydrothermal vent metagenome TaxID=652676 RepID=A0A3B0Z3S5_9ZZZZ
MVTIEHLLGDISLPTFLKEYWQKKPLLIRNAIPDYSCPITANDMAGLACEEGVESRIILGKNNDHWECRYGPFDDAEFSQLPDTCWTLLLQSCNLYVAEFAQLLERFRFIPSWRVDDIMLSYAAPGGSVGPHTDQYDVFLLQAEGQRHWSISTQAVSSNDFINDLEVKILKKFVAEQSWVLEPGDMLYLPPGVAHHGVAVASDNVSDSSELRSEVDSLEKSKDCITISIGFRAPDTLALSTALLDEILEQDTEAMVGTSLNSVFYNDSGLPLQKHSGEINAWALQRITSLMQKELTKQITNSVWFGKYITRTDDVVEVPTLDLSSAAVEKLIMEGQQLLRSEYSKFAFIVSELKDDNSKQAIQFFCNGEVSYYPLSAFDLISLLCDTRYPSAHLLVNIVKDDDALTLLCELVNQGHFTVEL